MRDNIFCNCITDLRASHLGTARERRKERERERERDSAYASRGWRDEEGRWETRPPREIGLNDMRADSTLPSYVRQ